MTIASRGTHDAPVAQTCNGVNIYEHVNGLQVYSYLQKFSNYAKKTHGELIFRFVRLQRQTGEVRIARQMACCACKPPLPLDPSVASPCTLGFGCLSLGPNKQKVATWIFGIVATVFQAAVKLS
jgi:hypothetical protein